MKIKVFIKDALTNEVIRNNEVETSEFTFEQMCKHHELFKNIYPNAHINFSWLPKGAKDTSFICGMPLNMQLDEENMPFEDYCAKWYRWEKGWKMYNRV